MKIISAKWDHEPEIRRIWTECFHDEKEYLDLFFQYRFQPNLTKLLIIGTEVAGMIHLLPCKIAPNQDAYYWYAVGISEKFRGNGYFHKFVDAVLEENKKFGYANVCKPRKGLEALYQKHGFIYPYYEKEIAFTREITEKNNQIKIEAGEPKDFVFETVSHGTTIWDLKSIEYAIKENEFCDGKTMRFQINEENYFSLAIHSERGWILNHGNVSEIAASIAKDSILGFLKTDQFILKITDRNSNTFENISGLSDSPLVGAGSSITFTLD